MVQYAGSVECPKCKVPLFHEYDLASDWTLPNQVTSREPRLICPRCGYFKPVVYRINRPGSV